MKTKYVIPAVEIPEGLPVWHFVDMGQAHAWLESEGVRYRPIGLRRMAEEGRVSGAFSARGRWWLPRMWVAAVISANSAPAASTGIPGPAEEERKAMAAGLTDQVEPRHV